MISQQPSVLLIDGTSYIFRAFYALPPLTNKAGLPTGALYGFCAMLHKLLQDYPHIPMVLFFDAGGQNWRHQRYAAYKQHRQAPPDDLLLQMTALSEILPYFGIPIVQQKGIEADDLIAVVARKYSHLGVVLISSPDKDFTQLISPTILLEQSFDSRRYDKATIESKYGVAQSQIKDYFALIGDISDGIPGVPKIGPKTAQKLLQQYGTLEAILEAAEHIPGAIGRSIEAHKEQALLSRELFSLATEEQVPFPELLPQSNLPPLPQLHIEKLFDFYERYELRSLFPRLKVPPLYPRVTITVLQKVPETLPQKVALWPCDEGIAWAADLEQVYFIEKQHVTYFFDTLIRNNCEIIVPDYSQIRPLAPQPLPSYHDISLMAYIIAADLPSDFESLEKRLFDTRPQPALIAEKASWVLMAYEILLKQLTPPLKKLLLEMEYPLAEILYQMQQNGICVDIPMLQALSDEWVKELEILRQKIVQLCGIDFNINSSKQLREVLFDTLKLRSTQKTPKGELSTKEDVLLTMRAQHPVIDLLLSYRHLEKLRSTYTLSLIQQVSPETQRLHTTFNQKGTVTGRLASSQPNLQNIPVKTTNGRLIRRAFCAPEGKTLVFFDYSQIELRLMAHLSQDPFLIKAYQEGADIHKQTAMLVLGLREDEIGPQQRQIAKTVNFGLLYGMSAYGLSQQLQLSPKKAQEFIDIYFEQFPAVRIYMTAMRDFAKEHGYVTTLLGRKIPIRVEGRRGSAEHAWRAAINGPLQGSASDLIKKAMIDVQKIVYDTGAKMLLQVHDELIFESNTETAEQLVLLIKPVMESAMSLDVPLIAQSKIAARWE